jgi:hypothetical protein
LLCYGGVLDTESLPLHTSSSGGCGFSFRVTARRRRASLLLLPPSLPLFPLLTSPNGGIEVGRKGILKWRGSQIGEGRWGFEWARGQGDQEQCEHGLVPSHSLVGNARRGSAGKLGVWDFPGAKLWFRGGLKARDP